jgi:phytoene/squalene synthetase
MNAMGPWTSLLADRFAPETLDGAPILELGARVWPPERYQAFCLCYRTMRWVDDLVDHHRSAAVPFAEVEKDLIRKTISAWMLGDGPQGRPAALELETLRRRLHLPLWPWERWTRSMLWDLEHDGFRTFSEFLRYSEGAAVAPGAIFMHLCGIREEGSICRPPDFDIRRPARPLAIFAYLVHIMRDFQSDQLQNLHYFADQLLERHGLGRNPLRRIAEGDAIPPSFRRLMRQYRGFADHYRRQARTALDRIFGHLDPEYQLSLEIIYGLYLQIFEKLDPESGGFTTAETHPTCQETRERLVSLIGRFKPA